MRYNRRVKVFQACALLFVLGAAGCSLGTTAIDQRAANASAASRSAPITDSVRRKLFVANRSSNAITVYADSADGDVKPLFKIRGSNTRLSAPMSLGFDQEEQLYVLNAASIAVFAPKTAGNTAPAPNIAGGLTQLSNPQAMAVDPPG